MTRSERRGEQNEILRGAWLGTTAEPAVTSSETFFGTSIEKRSRGRRKKKLVGKNPSAAKLFATGRTANTFGNTYNRLEQKEETPFSIPFLFVLFFLSARVKRDEPKWLELAVGVDHSVIEFHGQETVKRYILTLLNIVSAIYGDPTLGANLQFVISRIIFLENVRPPLVDPIRAGNSKQSLANVNRYIVEYLLMSPAKSK